MPDITVLMSVYNGQKYLRDSIDSILNQTCSDFEFLIVNDGSTDNSPNIIKSYNDPRIRLINNPRNLGLTRSLNIGLEAAHCEFIARQDADDLSDPSRLEQQLVFIKTHPNTVFLSTWGNVIDEENQIVGKICCPTNSKTLEWRLLLDNVIPHTSVMFRRSVVNNIGGYSKTRNQAQDYDLWLKIMRQYKLAVMDKILVSHRRHKDSVTNTKFIAQEKTAIEIIQENLILLLNLDINKNILEDLRRVLRNELVYRAEHLREVSEALYRIYTNVMATWQISNNERYEINLDYARIMQRIASMHADLSRRGTIPILKKACFTAPNVYNLLLSIKCLLKVITGPKWIKRLKKYKDYR